MQTLRDKFIGLDAYGENVSVNYRGESFYKTRFGASLSLVTLLLLLVFAFKNGQKLIFRESPQITVTREILDLANDETSYNLKEAGVVIVFETIIQTDDGPVYNIPDDVGRFVGF